MNTNRSKLPSSTNSTSLPKPATTFRTSSQQLQRLVPVKSGLVSPSFKLSTSISQARLANKSIVTSTSAHSLNNGKNSTTTINKSVPLVPPRKSSIPRPSPNGTSLSFKPQPPKRGSSTTLSFHKPHVSHL